MNVPQPAVWHKAQQHCIQVTGETEMCPQTTSADANHITITCHIIKGELGGVQGSSTLRCIEGVRSHMS